MFHGLNTLRVLAEFLVVYAHIAIAMDQPLHPVPMEIMHDTMSLFFCLSGFVTMHRGCDNSKLVFWKRKLYKSGILFYVMITWHLITRLTRNSGPTSPLEYVCTFTEFFFFSNWLGCHNVWVHFSMHMWYLSCLFSFWFVFPFVDKSLGAAFRTHTWAKLILLYVALLLASFYIPFRAFTFAPFRAIEFVMGCATALTLERPLPRFVCAACCALAVFYYLVMHWYVRWHWCLQEPSGPYAQVVYGNENPPCYPATTKFTGPMSLCYCVLIHTVAARGWLRHPVAEFLNPYSLYTYSLHMEIFDKFQRVLALLGFSPAPLTFVILAVYVGSVTVYEALAKVEKRIVCNHNQCSNCVTAPIAHA